MLRILVVNPGSTSTKLSFFEDTKELFTQVLRHTEKELAPFPDITSQYPFREKIILEFLKEKNILLDTLDAVVGRGGLLYPLESGTYEVDDIMVEHLKKGVQGQHASNLGGILAREIAEKADARAFIVDPVIVDEMDKVAKLSGNPKLTRRSIFHALNHKAVARKAAAKLGKKYEEVNLIVAHLGGGISIGAHKKGRVVDVNNALNGDGPYAPERSGGLPAGDLAKLCFSGKYTLKDVMRMLRGKGGVVAYLGTRDIREVVKRVKSGDEYASLILEGMAYQVAKEIGALSTVLEGEIDAIILTGGIAYNEFFTDKIIRRVKFLAPVLVYPGEEEMKALAEGAYRVLTGEEVAKRYRPEETT